MANRLALGSLWGIALAMLSCTALAAPYAYVPRTNGVTVIDLQSESVVADIPLPGTPVGIGARVGSRYVYISNGTDRVWTIDTVPQAIVATIEMPQPTAIAVDRVTPRAFVATGCPPPGPCLPVVETRVTTINTNSQSVGGTRSVPGLNARRLELTASGERLLLTGDSKALSVDTDSPNQHANVTVTGTAGGASWVPDSISSFFVAVDQGASGSIYAHPAGAYASAGAGAADVVVHPQGTFVYAANAGANTVTVVNAATLAGVAVIPVGTRPEAIDVSPTGDKVYVVNTVDNTVSIISTASNTVTRTVPLPPGTALRGRFIGGVAISQAPGPLSGLWWNASQPGWGLYLAQRREIVFAAWFTYDAAGQRKWYVASACRMPPLTCPTCVENTTCDGDLFEMTGPRFFIDNFQPSVVRPTFAGGIRIDFRDRNNASFTYSLGTRNATVPIVRQVFSTSGPVGATDYTDLWWNPGESGWGLGVTHQFGVMFLAWFVYDDNGRPVWYVASNCAVEPGGNGCSGKLYRTSGPAGPASGVPFDPAAVAVTEVGTVTLRFGDPDNGTLSYTVDGRPMSKTITRQTF